MKTTIVGRKMTVSDSLKELVGKKLKKFDKFFDENAEAFVTFSKKRSMEIIEVTITSGGTLFRGEEEDTTFNNALDSAIESLERQLRKNKTRLEKRLREGAFIHSDNDIEVDEETDFKIRTKTFSFKPMTAEEAILQMNLLGHQFFVFKDADTADTCVVYKRKDGAYGMIMPD